MPALLRASGFFFLLLLGGCASTPPAGPNHLYERNIVFTVPAGSVTSEFATGYTRQGDGPGVQNVIQAVLQFHGLKRVSQVTIQTLNVEAVVAEFGGNRSLDEVLRALAEDQRVESVQPVKRIPMRAWPNSPASAPRHPPSIRRSRIAMFEFPPRWLEFVITA